MAGGRRRHPRIERSRQSDAQREYNRLRTAVPGAYGQLERRADNETRGLPPRVRHYVMAVVELWKRRGGQHVETFLGPRALGSTGRQSTSSYKRAKANAFDVWENGDGERVLGLGLLWRSHIGGGRLAREQGGGRDEDGRFKGNAEGVMPGPTITGWTPEQYRRLKLGPPPAPAPETVLAREAGESEAAHRDRERRHLAYLQKQGLEVASGPDP